MAKANKAKDECIKKENIEENVAKTKNSVKIENNAEMNLPAQPAATKTNNGAWILAIVFGAMVILALSYGYNNILSKKMLEKGCSELSKSPDLKYPTVCVPLDADSNRGDYVDQKSEPMCRCKVDTGNGTSTVIDIRLAN